MSREEVNPSNAKPGEEPKHNGDVDGSFVSMRFAEGRNAAHHKSVGELTVGKKSRVERELHKHEEASHAPSCALTFIKWFVGVLVSLVFTFCLVVSKVAVINITHALVNQTTESVKRKPWPPLAWLEGDVTQAQTPQTSLAMLLVLMSIPNFTTFVRSTWSGAFTKERPWPAPKAVIAGLASSLLESVGLALFVIGVLPKTPPYVGVLLMNGVFLMYGASMLINTVIRKGIRNYPFLSITLILAVLVSTGGIILTIFCDSCPGMLRKGIQSWAIPVSLVCLSIAWCNPLQRLMLVPRMTDRLREQIERNTEKDNGQSNRDGNAVPSSESTAKSKQDIDDLITAYPQLSARWKNCIITSLLKLILTPGFCILFIYVLHGLDLRKLGAGFHSITPDSRQFTPFLINIICSFVGYLMGWLACKLAMQRLGFALPLVVATPVALVLVLFMDSCKMQVMEDEPDKMRCDFEVRNLAFIVPSAVCLYLAQILSTGYYVFQGQKIVMEKESQLFWLPGYSSVFLEQFFLLNRKTKQTDRSQEGRLERARWTRVFLCTTMYREAAHEMQQLLRSLGRINRATQQSERHFQAHIFFDNGVRHNRLTPFALQLIAVALKTLGLQIKRCKKIATPYGLQLHWKMPTVIEGKVGMDMFIHLKDNLKVKSKKRWSQIMYMSYVLDYFIRQDPEATDNNTFILATDADVDFTPASVEALLDLVTRNDKVGAVCARTYPMGSGPIVWYQTFDYAIGHWFQKAANHVLGSVLCCPGCFSVYRAEALRHVVPTYASSVTKASEFLTKDMGEDRWLCTLLVQSGWRLEYCAAADNRTYCPEEFEEFFKQRRRWVPSTLANLALLLQEWKTVYYFNNQISLMFLLYQATLLFSTLVSPSVCMLVVAGGLYYAWGVSQYVSVTLLYLVTVGYILTCLYASPDWQLKVAKLLTVLFAFIMAAVTIGTAVQVIEESEALRNATIAEEAPGLNVVELPLSVTSLYLVGIVLVFVMAAILHLPEAYCLLHGIWYLWCLPAGFIILLVYSIVNLTDRSWGTREEKKDTKVSGGIRKRSGFLEKVKRFFNCGGGTDEGPSENIDTQTGSANSEINNEAEGDYDIDDAVDGSGVPTGVRTSQDQRWSRGRGNSFRFHYQDRDDNKGASITEWLPSNLRDPYGGILQAAGYDDTSFLVGMAEDELQALGVSVKAHRQALLAEIRTLGDPDIEPFVPDTIEEWLTVVGLMSYYSNFRKLHIVSGKQLEILKNMSKDDITKELGISKPGHLKRLLLAIKKLRYPTESELEQGQVKSKMELLSTTTMSGPEQAFWEKLRQERLLPTSSAFSDDLELKAKLSELRDSTLAVFGVANTLWIILILTLVPKSQLNVLGTNALGLSFLVIFGSIVIIQFLCMLIHRLVTFVHLIARAPPKCGDPYHINWSWQDSNLRVPKSVRRKTTLFEESVDMSVSLRQSPKAPRCSTIAETDDHV